MITKLAMSINRELVKHRKMLLITLGLILAALIAPGAPIMAATLGLPLIAISALGIYDWASDKLRRGKPQSTASIAKIAARKKRRDAFDRQVLIVVIGLVLFLVLIYGVQVIPQLDAELLQSLFAVALMLTLIIWSWRIYGFYSLKVKSLNYIVNLLKSKVSAFSYRISFAARQTFALG